MMLWPNTPDRVKQLAPPGTPVYCRVPVKHRPGYNRRAGARQHYRNVLATVASYYVLYQDREGLDLPITSPWIEHRVVVRVRGKRRWTEYDLTITNMKDTAL